MTFILIILATLIISLLSFVGMVFLYFRVQVFHKFLLTLVSLSAGAMLGTSFFHLLPEALAQLDVPIIVFGYALFGFVMFFVLEQFMRWHHCHNSSHHGVQNGFHCHIKPAAHLVLYSDSVHNFIDGLVLAAAFLISPTLGIATALAIAFHEVPQEIGDFGVLLYSGLKKKRALVLNFISAMFVIAGGIGGYFLAQKVDTAVSFLIPFAAGSFIYIAATDLIPEIKHEENTVNTILHFLAFLAGIAIMVALSIEPV